jgi:uncharacterized protein (DUF305 family)
VDHQHHTQNPSHSWKPLALELGLDAVVMYFVMYTMIDKFDHLYPSLNNGYMTAMMVASMAVIMAATMKSMFSSARMRWGLAGAGALVGLLSFVGMRTQAGVDDASFLRAMIPHHSGAILMCERADLTDPEIVSLCGEIVRSQRAEIAKMKELLARR